jgi:O-antigen/teichoic acid export membrane protein
LDTHVQDFAARLSLPANVSWTLVGNGVYVACQWGMLVGLTKLGSPEMVGQFALGLAITAPIIMLTNLQLRDVQATDASSGYLFGDYLALRLLTTTLALLIIGGIAWGLGYRPETALIMVILGVAKAIEAISDVFYGLLQQHERMDRVAQSMMIKGIASLAALCIWIYLTGDLRWGVISLAVVWALVLLSYDVRSGRLILRHRWPRYQTALPEQNPRGAPKPHWDTAKLIKLTRLALPLGLVTMLMSLNFNLPRYFIERYWGEHELGIFAALAYILAAGIVVTNALGQSASPRLAKYYAARDRIAFVRLLLKLIGVSTVLGGLGLAGAILAGPELLTIFYQAEYARQDLLVWLMVAGVMAYVASCLYYALTATRYFRAQLLLFMGVTGSTTWACLWLIPTGGLAGAAMALIIAALVQVMGSVMILAHALRAISGGQPC